MGEVGVVKDVDQDGDLKVKFTSGTFTINSQSCTSLEPAKNTNVTQVLCFIISQIISAMKIMYPGGSIASSKHSHGLLI